MKPRKSQKPWQQNGVLLILLASVLFPTMGACLKYAMAEVHFAQAVFFRSFITVLIFVPVLKIKRISFFGSNTKGLILRGVFGTLSMACAFYALSHIPIGDAAVLHHTSPIFVAILSTFFLGERGGWPLGALILGALAGAILVIQPELNFFNFAGLIGLISAAFAAAAYTTIKYLHSTENSWRIALWFTLIASLGSLPFTIYYFEMPTLFTGLALVGAGLFGTVAQILMTMAYKWDEASRLSSLTYGGLIVSFAYGALFWGEIPNTISLIGAFVIVLCCLGVSQIKFRKKDDVPMQINGP
jgi:drug/metabolite transporter (DMT)-like permease